MTRKECYSILGLPDGTEYEEVKKAYRKRAFELHPDLNPSPDASVQFQRLNEAYVLLSSILENDNKIRYARMKARSAEREHPAYTDTNKEKSASAKHGDEKKNSSEPWKNSFANNVSGVNKPKNKPQFKTSKSAFDRYTRITKQDVMDSVLRDPFARRVFEDIYSRVRRTSNPQKAKRTKKNFSLEWGERKFSLDFSQGLISSFKGWLLRQIDDEQSVEVQAENLKPGARIRLQIQVGLSEKPKSVDIILPEDYVPGRPIRLRGLGRRIGPWQGDLYLKIMPKATG